MDKTEQQKTRDMFRAKKEADRIFSEKQQLKAQRIRDDERELQDVNVTLMVVLKVLHLHHVITKATNFASVKVMAIVFFIYRLQKLPRTSS